MADKDGQVPRGAVVGGQNLFGDVFVARTEHAGKLIIGKVIPKFRTCYIAYNGEEVRRREYEVTTHCKEVMFFFFACLIILVI